MLPASNELSPDRKPTPKRKPTDMLDEVLLEEEPMQMGMQQPQTQRLIPEKPLADFGRVEQIAQTSGLDVGRKLDAKLFSDVSKDPYEYVRIRSDPDLYRQFLGKAPEVQQEEPSQSMLSRLQKQSSPVAMPATQAQPPRPKVAAMNGMRRQR